MAKLDAKEERGLEVIGSMMGDTFRESMRSAAESGGFGSDITRMALSFSFNDSWGREGFDRRSKSLCVLSALIALRQPKELRNHVKIGVANGLTLADFEGLLVQLSSYVGFPCIASATTAVIEALREIGMDPDAKTAEEKGLL